MGKCCKKKFFTFEKNNMKSYIERIRGDVKE